MNHKFTINYAAATIARFRIANADILASRIVNSGERGCFSNVKPFFQLGWRNCKRTIWIMSHVARHQTNAYVFIYYCRFVKTNILGIWQHLLCPIGSDPNALHFQFLQDRFHQLLVESKFVSIQHRNILCHYFLGKHRGNLSQKDRFEYGKRHRTLTVLRQQSRNNNVGVNDYITYDTQLLA